MKTLITITYLLVFSIFGFSQNLTEDSNGDKTDKVYDNLRNKKYNKLKSGNSLNVIKTIPSPISNIHDITYDGQNLWGAGFGYNYLYKISMIDGTKLDSIPTSLLRPYGLTFDGQYLWVSDAESDIIQKVDTIDGTVIQTFNAPALSPSYSAGLAFDGVNIWQNDQRERRSRASGDSTFVINPNGTLINEYEAKGDFPGGLTYDGTYLWSTDNYLDEIHKIDVSTFSIIETYDSPSNIPLGLAFDGQYLWIADNGSYRLYQIDIGIVLSNSDLNFLEKSIITYPNPSNGLINIDLNETYPNVKISIVDIAGKVVKSSNHGHTDFIQVDLTLNEGIFFLVIQTDQKSYSQKLIIE